MYFYYIFVTKQKADLYCTYLWNTVWLSVFYLPQVQPSWPIIKEYQVIQWELYTWSYISAYINKPIMHTQM